MTRRLVLTGASGRLGRHLLPALTEAAGPCIGLDRADGFDLAAPNHGARPISRDSMARRRCCLLAALAHRAVEPELIRAFNVEGSAALAREAKKRGHNALCPGLLDLCRSAVGDHQRDAYGRAKFEAEAAISALFGTGALVLRFTPLLLPRRQPISGVSSGWRNRAARRPSATLQRHAASPARRRHWRSSGPPCSFRTGPAWAPDADRRALAINALIAAFRRGAGKPGTDWHVRPASFGSLCGLPLARQPQQPCSSRWRSMLRRCFSAASPLRKIRSLPPKHMPGMRSGRQIKPLIGIRHGIEREAAGQCHGPACFGKDRSKVRSSRSLRTTATIAAASFAIKAPARFDRPAQAEGSPDVRRRWRAAREGRLGQNARRASP